MPFPNLPSDFDFTDPDIYAVERLPVDELGELRRVAPTWWNAQPTGAEAFGDDGYWLVTRIRTCARSRSAMTCSPAPANCVVLRYPDAESGRGQIERAGSR